MLSEAIEMLKGLLVAAFVLVCLGVIAVSYVVPRIQVHKESGASGDRVNVDTPFGSVHVDGQKNAPIDLGDIPIYPGAERAKKDGNGAVMKFDWGSGEKQFSVSGAEFTTGDSVSTVREWYQGRLPGWDTNGKEMTRVENGIRRVISVKERDGRTRIGIAIIGGEAAAN